MTGVKPKEDTKKIFQLQVWSFVFTMRHGLSSSELFIVSSTGKKERKFKKKDGSKVIDTLVSIIYYTRILFSIK